MSSSVEHAADAAARADADLTASVPAVMVVRTARGWSVMSPGSAEEVGDLVEGLSLADLFAEESGTPTDPDRTARRAARGPAGPAADPDADPRDMRIAALERTVAQLEHALAARVSTERAIGVLAERHGTSPRSAFELIRGQARAEGRPVHELAREVLEGLDERPAVPLTAAPAAEETTALPPAPRGPSGRRTRTRAAAVPAADGRP
ncbi:ANTAR domain-containing protein [Blastococcus sp. SYSU D00820]